ncbi:serine/threonine protein phosphatase PrpC [Deinococcus metalli]|uniref:Serine/threonine protein phosphatase PrpC n=1 Tax=Deinococcus metalli TaxID=1141878 RepID=A0A7W8NTL2_9DEIO|nr:protein phosphatase 2C domain-containing protein [Deinococcus metalli]MBB5379248.1 serine/threonine protein phosphatase PrpC [Deinococcus metalli]GHF65711.1 hypothetical protein GCM10017781_46790 [Deinococcus metalli]
MADTDDRPQPQDWEDTAATLRDLFGNKAQVQDAAPAEAAEPDLTAFDTGEHPLPVLGEDALPAELPAAEHTEFIPADDAPTVTGDERSAEPSHAPLSIPAAGSVENEEPQADSTPVPAAPPLPTPTPVPSPAPAPVGFSNDLEEEVYAPSAPTSGPAVGDEVDGYHLNEDMGRGWFIASPLASGPSVEVYARPEPLWARAQPHRALPRFTQAGTLHVLDPVGGEPLRAPLDAGAALAHITELARLIFALEKQGLAVVDLDPDAPRVTPQGLRLRFPPRVARVGDVPEVAVREGYTPPEVLAGQPVDARSGVYALGALLYTWLTGGTLPPEGASDAVLGGLSVAGVPQLLRGMLGPPLKRLEPAQVLAALKTLALPALPAYHVAAATSVGLNPERPMNEDSYGFTWRQLGVHATSTVALRACVSDGMGGMAAGEVASAAAVQAFLNSEKTTLPEMVWDANAAVLAAMVGRDGGCTFSGVDVRGPQLQLGHVGDTRAYVRQGGVVRQLSRDHSYVAAMVASGQMTPEEAQTSPERNKVLRSLGSLRVPQDNYVQTLDAPLELTPGDRVLLVSDGVWGEVPDAELMPLLDTLPLQELVDRLIDLALAAGAPDNATALVIERVR